ncbi:MAG: alpha-ketoacid dehydrogenase subunit beta [Elusimicrobia bacterium]|nr:alpha-ketoacid dehydrogenase subunit beta [Elusimicrobiota bacterium]
MKFGEAVREALDFCLGADPDVVVMGLGVPDPKGVFGTTVGLQKKHGAKRVMDMPTAENGMTGVLLGATLAGLRPVMVHQRLDFAVLAVEQIVNQAAKWRYMYGGRQSAPLVFRLITGRGWGQGTQHAQSLHSWFAHIPGLKVVMPATPGDAKGLLISAVEDDDPVVFIEHRWLHGVHGDVPAGAHRVPLGSARVARAGHDVTLFGVSYMVLECLRAAEFLAEHGVSAEVFDPRTLRPFDEAAFLASVRKTGRLVVADTSWTFSGFSAEAAALAADKAFSALKAPIKRLGLADCPMPSTPALANLCYPRAQELVDAAWSVCGKAGPAPRLPAPTTPLDVPDPSFTGPF